MSALNKTKKVKKLAEAFARVQTTAQLAQFLTIAPHQLRLLADFPAYHCFTIPKNDGSSRYIEDPQKPLKKIQQQLNDALQCGYFCHKTTAAYGFMINPADDADPRNIRTNAQRHLGRPWLLNGDFEDFFHSISTDTVVELLLTDKFSFDEPTALLLAQLTTFNGRLPMGAPTSPALSNWAMLTFDSELLDWAHQRSYIYTRFADDLSFSGAMPFSPQMLQELRSMAQVNGFRFNEQKFKIYSPKVEKIVTGLVVGQEAVALPSGFVPELEGEIAKLQTVLEVQHRTGKTQSVWVDKYRQQIAGHLRFASFILGDDHPQYRRLQHLLEIANEPPNGYDSASWLQFNYNF